MTHGIKNAILIYNPTSGRRRHRRFQDVEQAARILKEAGIATELAPTTGPNSATAIARLAVEQRRGVGRSSRGGDGTVNEVVNGLAGSQVSHGAPSPAGTANILATELGIPWDIPQAARLISGGTIRRIALGIAVPMNGNHSEAMPKEGRYFLSVAGAGPDGAIVNGVDAALKKRVGVGAYWAEGFRQFFQYGFPEMRVHSGGKERSATIIVIGRTVNYGGPFKNRTTGASLFEDSFEMLIQFQAQPFVLRRLPCRPIWMGALRKVDGIEAWKSAEVVCVPANGEKVFAQVDGEPIGAVPIAFRIVPDALSLLTPAPRNT